MGSLSDAFLAHAGSQRERFAAGPELEALLGGLLETGRNAWPSITLAPETFLRQLAERLSTDEQAAAALGTVHAADLYLACACAGGDPEALRVFERAVLGPIVDQVARRSPQAPADELKQALRTRLLVAPQGEGARPRIAGYSGQGPLTAWLRMAAARVVIDLQRAQKEQAPFDEEAPFLIEASGPDPEIAYLKSRYRTELEEAFRTTLGSLEARDRAVLALHFLEGMRAEAIAAIYQVSARTVERWIASARERILDETRRLLAGKLRIAPSQVETLLGLVHSQFDVSICKVLRGSGDP